MKYDSQKNNRRSIRLQGYDYSKNGYYFITICTHNNKNYFGKIENEIMTLSQIGNFTEQCWKEIPNHFPDVELGTHTIMPNHIHGIIKINKKIMNNVGVQNLEPLHYEPLHIVNKFQHIIPKSIGSIVRGFKIGVTKLCNNKKTNFKWQRNYYEHIIRDENSYNEICKYINNNPTNWKKDKLFN